MPELKETALRKDSWDAAQAREFARDPWKLPQRTLIKQPILPRDCANAILWLASDQSAKTTGHLIPVDGGLSGAFLR
jgi:NAD(P)-dependent dehydrogenase (short-subunit alcohol dehydrogenase family)